MPDEPNSHNTREMMTKGITKENGMQDTMKALIFARMFHEQRITGPIVEKDVIWAYETLKDVVHFPSFFRVTAVVWILIGRAVLSYALQLLSHPDPDPVPRKPAQPQPDPVPRKPPQPQRTDPVNPTGWYCVTPYNKHRKQVKLRAKACEMGQRPHPEHPQEYANLGTCSHECSFDGPVLRNAKGEDMD